MDEKGKIGLSKSLGNENKVVLKLSYRMGKNYGKILLLIIT
jgi:hypothetical protein